MSLGPFGRHNVADAHTRVVPDPVAATAVFLVALTCVLALRTAFDPGELFFILYAAGLTLPPAVWARQVSFELALTPTRCMCVIVLAWCLPIAIYGLVAGSVWVVLGRRNGNAQFAGEGAALFATGCAVLSCVVFVERLRRRARATLRDAPPN